MQLPLEDWDLEADQVAADDGKVQAAEQEDGMDLLQEAVQMDHQTLAVAAAAQAKEKVEGVEVVEEVREQQQQQQCAHIYELWRSYSDAAHDLGHAPHDVHALEWQVGPYSQKKKEKIALVLE